MKTNCTNFRKWYPRLMDERLTGNDGILARAHLSGCEKCRNLAMQIESAIGQNVSGSADMILQARILSRISEMTAKELKPRNVYKASLLRVAAAAAVLLLGVYAGRQLSVHPSDSSEDPDILLASEFSLTSGPDDSAAIFLND